MNKELTSIVKKTAKIAGVTCVAAGAVALMTSGAALKALTVGGKYLKDTIQKIVNENPDADVAAEEVVEAEAETEVAEVVAEEAAEVPAVEAVAEEQDFAEAEAQEA